MGVPEREIEVTKEAVVAGEAAGELTGGMMDASPAKVASAAAFERVTVIIIGKLRKIAVKREKNNIAIECVQQQVHYNLLIEKNDISGEKFNDCRDKKDKKEGTKKIVRSDIAKMLHLFSE